MSNRNETTDSPSTSSTLQNVRVFDGRVLREPSTVVIESGVISGSSSAGAEVDCGGATLLPGLIDAHVHLHQVANLEQFAAFGVTTALDMASWPPSFVDSLRGRPGLADIRSAGGSATAPGSTHSKIPDFPEDGILSGPGEAEKFVEVRVAEGSDYIKIIADIPGPDQETMNAIVAAARKNGKMTIVHAGSHAAYEMGVKSGADILTHIPLDRTLDPAVVEQMVEQGQASVPTLSMMEGIVTRLITAGIAPAPDSGTAKGPAYAHCRESVKALAAAGVPLIAGTDANAAPFAPAAIPHGESLHHELELLVDAGLSTLDALIAATALPAKVFGLEDRGRIAPGLRADLVLIVGNPLSHIDATRNIQRVWCGGIEYPLN